MHELSLLREEVQRGARRLGRAGLGICIVGVVFLVGACTAYTNEELVLAAVLGITALVSAVAGALLWKVSRSENEHPGIRALQLGSAVRWVYIAEVNGIPSLRVGVDDGMLWGLPIPKGQEEIVLRGLRDAIPNAVFGWTAQRELTFRSNPASFRG